MPYNLSFTTGSLFVNETKKIAKLYVETKDWEKTREKVLKGNVIQKNSQKTILKEFYEIRKRLKNLNASVIEKIAKSENGKAKQLIFFSTVKTYRILFDFIREILRTKALVFNYQLSDADFNKFFKIKTETNPELEDITETTKAKVKQVIFRILAEVGMIDSIKQKNIIPFNISNDIISIIIKDDPKYLEAFLIPDSDIKSYKLKFSQHA